MAEEHRFQSHEGHRLCVNNCGFFGSPATMNLCSKCYRDFCLKEQQQASIKSTVENSLSASPSSSSSPSPFAGCLPDPPALTLPEVNGDAEIKEDDMAVVAEQEQQPQQPQPNRCLVCRKRVGLTGFKCKCGTTFCGTHRFDMSPCFDSSCLPKWEEDEISTEVDEGTHPGALSEAHVASNNSPSSLQLKWRSFDTELLIEGWKNGPCQVGLIHNRVGPFIAKWFAATCLEMVRKVNASRITDSSNSSESLEWSFERDSTRSAFEARGPLEGEEPEVVQPCREGDDGGLIRRLCYRENKMTAERLGQIAKEFSIRESVGMRMPLAREQVSNPHGVSVAFHPAFLEIGAKLPLHPYIRRVFREFVIASAQLNPNGWRVVIGMYALWCGMGFPAPTLQEIAHCYSFFPHRSGGDGWWALACCDKGFTYAALILLCFKCALGKLTVIAKKRIEGKGKGVEDGTKKRMRVISGVTMLPAGLSSKTHTPKCAHVTETSGGVTISKAAPNPPNVIPLDHSVVDKPLAFVIFLESNGIEGGPPTYYADPPAFEYDTTQSPIAPDNGINFFCSYAKNMLRSREATIFGKMSTAIGTLLETKKKYEKVKDVNTKLHDKIKHDQVLVRALKDNLGQASSSYQKSKALCRKKQAKLLDYRNRLREANQAIATMKRDLGENAIDRYAISDECYDQHKETFDRAVEEFKVMLGNTYLDFDFSEFNKEVADAFATRVKSMQDLVEDLSLRFSEVALSDEDPTDVSSDDERFLEDPRQEKEPWKD
ncbi:hypothetical protein EZV62_016120 [Acer yangbiense]|uniref:A20-type domain-containing protein n=1 Tax=Acer yangbiense TaxID=1000413 RepID=A0A5C7HMN4_9ROSI|nr:hypothetical protein EZV62_016120 [Acer yangbiense]